MSGDTKKYKEPWIELCKKGELVCALCLKKIEKISDITYDHWMPKSLGGPTNEENGRPAHPRCNSLKGCIPPDIFEQHREEILSGTYHLTQSYSLKPKKGIVYGEPIITMQNGHEVQKTYKRSHYKKKPKSGKALKKAEKQEKKYKREERKRKLRRERKKKTKLLYQASYKLAPVVLDSKDIFLGQVVGELRRIFLGQNIRYEVARYIVIGFVDNKPIARELYETKDKKLMTRIVEINKPIDYNQGRIFARKLNSFLNQRMK